MVPMSDPQASDGVPSTPIARVIAVLEGVARHAGPIGVRELSRSCDVDRSSVSRITLQLAALGVLARSEQGEYSPGPRLVAIAHQLRTASSSEALVRLATHALCSATGETAAAVGRTAVDSRVLHVAIGRGPVTVLLTEGSVVPPFLASAVAQTHTNATTPITATAEGTTIVTVPVGVDATAVDWTLIVAAPCHRADPATVAAIEQAIRTAAAKLRDRICL